MQPDKVLVLERSNAFEQFPNRYQGEGVMWVKGAPLPDETIPFLKDLDVLFTVETPHSHRLLEVASFMGIKSVIQYNYEFLPYIKNPSWPKPTLFASPTKWHYKDVPYNKTILPVPIALDRFEPFTPPKKPTNLLHVIGKPAANDRNGTEDLLRALKYVKSHIKLTLKTQFADYADDMMARFKGEIPEWVEVTIDASNQENYWEGYKDQHMLVLPRRYGGLSLPVNEALGAGLPVIMPKISPNEWLPEEWLVPATKLMDFDTHNMVEVFEVAADQLAHKIDWMCKPINYKAAVDKAQALAQKYSWDRLKPMYVDTFENVLL